MEDQTHDHRFSTGELLSERAMLKVTAVLLEVCTILFHMVYHVQGALFVRWAKYRVLAFGGSIPDV